MDMVKDERCWDVAVTKKTLTSDEYHFSDKELRYLSALSSVWMLQNVLNVWSWRQLVGYGLLLPQKQPDLYWFAIRRQGLFMSNYTKGRVEILRMLKRRPTKDMLEKVRWYNQKNVRLDINWFVCIKSYSKASSSRKLYLHMNFFCMIWLEADAQKGKDIVMTRLFDMF